MDEGGNAQQGHLVIVATPIGNLGDVSDRAREVLASADLICCEDTRRTRSLLSALGVAAGGAHGDRLLSVHGHNERSRVDRVLTCITGGGTVAVVSDAGTPGVSDPGSLLVEAAVSAGHAVTVVPGPSSAVAALVVSGLPTERFCVEGFLPRKGGDRRERLVAVLADRRTTVVFEAPGRVVSTLQELAALEPDRPVAVARELTKLHEEVWRGTMTEALAAWQGREVKGEVVLVIGGAPPSVPPDDRTIDDAVRMRLAERSGEGPRQIAADLAAELGVPRRRVYETVLRLRDESKHS